MLTRRAVTFCSYITTNEGLRGHDYTGKFQETEGYQKSIWDWQLAFVLQHLCHIYMTIEYQCLFYVEYKYD